jgi:hypothetical protein
MFVCVDTHPALALSFCVCMCRKGEGWESVWVLMYYLDTTKSVCVGGGWGGVDVVLANFPSLSASPSFVLY